MPHYKREKEAKAFIANSEIALERVINRELKQALNAARGGEPDFIQERMKKRLLKAVRKQQVRLSSMAPQLKRGVKESLAPQSIGSHGGLRWTGIAPST
ncbi:hypothetical protein O9992_00335 [Vibrio lentus]|nr:hypothetical protein [Vibrio lentus]